MHIFQEQGDKRGKGLGDAKPVLPDMRSWVGWEKQGQVSQPALLS